MESEPVPVFRDQHCQSPNCQQQLGGFPNSITDIELIPSTVNVAEITGQLLAATSRPTEDLNIAISPIVLPLSSAARFFISTETPSQYHHIISSLPCQALSQVTLCHDIKVTRRYVIALCIHRKEFGSRKQTNNNFPVYCFDHRVKDNLIRQR